MSTTPIQWYNYLGDHLTDPRWKTMFCMAVRTNGKCIRGRNGSMLVEFEDGTQVVVLARRLRKCERSELPICL